MSNTSFENDLVAQLGDLGRHITEVREFRGLTLAALSKSAGIGMQTLIRIEDGSTGVGVLNLHKVLSQLGLPWSLIPVGLPHDGAAPGAKHALHLDSPSMQAALDVVTKDTCNALNELLGVTYPERNGIGSNFQGLLRDHLAAMLCGDTGAKPRYASQLKRLVYSEGYVGGPLYPPSDKNVKGWVLVARDEGLILQDARLIRLDDETFDPWVSRQAALDGFAEFVENKGHPPGRIDAVPVFTDENGTYHF